MSSSTASRKFGFATGTNANYIESLYADYRRNPDSVDLTWRQFFEGYEFAATGGLGSGSDEGKQNAKVEALINAYRRLGHLSAHLNPLAPKPNLQPDLLNETHGLKDIDTKTVMHPANLPQSEMTYGEILTLLQDTYCGTIGADFREINDIETVVWFQNKMETVRNRPGFDASMKKRILEQLCLAEGFERFLQDRYLGQKRFSLEGNDSLMPMMRVILDDGARLGVEEINLGMAHRGRLNILTNFMGKHPEMILKEFEGTEFNPFDIDGDVKYHKGFASEADTVSGKKVRLLLLPNPSHLEAVNPVVEGFCRARQATCNDADRTKILPILMHGDAAFMGQGVVAETLNLSGLADYETGGTIHIITNNQVGFTAEPRESRSCTYASEIAKMVRAPVLHVNADDPEAVAWTAQLAIEYRQKFHKDIVIDLIGYRRHGHNETDEPMYTQPLMYKTIKAHPTCLTIYTDKLVSEKTITADDARDMMKKYRDLMQESMEKVRAGKSKYEPATPAQFKPILAHKKTEREDFEQETKTAVSSATVQKVGKAICTLPKGFNAHPKLNKLLESRLAMLDGEGQYDWGMAELLAFGSLAHEGHPVRLSGQDCQRGTFSHRHAVLKDFETGSELRVLNQISDSQAQVEIVNSPLSEFGVMGFEFGYSVALPTGLTLWEAQFGDFANGAQTVIDQFLVASEAKWKQTSSLTLLLPHGYEGQGPEHSNARPERFLQLCGNLNIIVVNPTTPAQYFHVLRRQVMRSFRKPLIVMTPKSLLRHPRVISTTKELSSGKFHEVIDDTSLKDPSKVKRVVVCSGKLFYELTESREKQLKDQSVAVIRVEQLYPFPDKLLKEILTRYDKAKEIMWAQEEPMNMGAWYFVRHRLEALIDGKFKLSYVGRRGSGTTAEGSQKAHVQEQTRIINVALGLEENNGVKD
jgi:2-oxoglutarate dehydrogenase E1 component